MVECYLTAFFATPAARRKHVYIGFFFQLFSVEFLLNKKSIFLTKNIFLSNNLFLLLFSFFLPVLRRLCFCNLDNSVFYFRHPDCQTFYRAIWTFFFPQGLGVCVLQVNAKPELAHRWHALDQCLPTTSVLLQPTVSLMRHLRVSLFFVFML